MYRRSRGCVMGMCACVCTDATFVAPARWAAHRCSGLCVVRAALDVEEAASFGGGLRSRGVSWGVHSLDRGTGERERCVRTVCSGLLGGAGWLDWRMSVCVAGRIRATGSGTRTARAGVGGTMITAFRRAASGPRCRRVLRAVLGRGPRAPGPARVRRARPRRHSRVRVETRFQTPNLPPTPNTCCNPHPSPMPSPASRPLSSMQRAHAAEGLPHTSAPTRHLGWRTARRAALPHDAVSGRRAHCPG